MQTNSALTEKQQRKKLGSYYTPVEVACVLADWAIKTPADLVLEPSFGGCGFLDASQQRLLQLGNFDAIHKNIFGCDIDAKAFTHLADLTDDSDNTNYLKADFLSLSPKDFKNVRFDVVLGNPPYVSHHNMDSAQIERAQAVLEASAMNLHKRASLWAYFVLHSFSFLKIGGRVAWILPSSFLHADYAYTVRQLIADNFAKSFAIQVGERFFLNDGAKEVTVLLLCDGWKENNADSQLRVAYAPSIDNAKALIRDWSVGRWKGDLWNDRVNLHLLSPDVREIYQSIIDQPETRIIGELCDIRIGIVTGANRFFVVNQDTAAQAGLADSDLDFIIAKYGDFRGLCLHRKDLGEARSVGKRCLLVAGSIDGKLSASQQVYFDNFPEDARESNLTFKKRRFWYQPNDLLIPDAFFPYMTQDGPSILLNAARVNSTNTVHRLYFKDAVTDTQQRLFAISLLSSFSQMSAEIESRAYGSGVLKHEPSEIARIRVVIPRNVSLESVNEVFDKVDNLLRMGEVNQAEELANHFIFQNGAFAVSQKSLSLLKSEIDVLRERRRNYRGHTGGKSASLKA